jgi:hypothetical protein
VCEIEQGLISHVVLETSSLMNFLECDPCIPRPETDQGIEQAIREIKRKVGLPLDDPKSATTIHASASNQSAGKTLHTTTFAGKSPKSSTNKIRSGCVAKLPSSKQRKPRRVWYGVDVRSICQADPPAGYKAVVPRRFSINSLHPFSPPSSF